MSKQLPTQTQRLYFVGQDGSMGFIHGHAYMVSVRRTTKLERLRYRSEYVMVSPKFCPYKNGASFYANWRHSDPNLTTPQPAAPGTLYKPETNAKPRLPRFNKDLLRSLGFDDWREFAIDFGQWAHTNDFTYQGNLYDPASGGNFAVLLNAYLQERLAADVE